ncbi:MAG: tetratricopeptide repeat protein [Bacteroidia bacterium]|nr:tetratricopeptide repeat protein [Bacteroidia bacterium]MDW8015300.1 tetratricopeptide repeat protein [Bacteroidia bacterium]
MRLLFLGIGLVGGWALAQSGREIDSLERLLRQGRLPDTTYLTTCITLSKLYLNISERRALEYARQAFPIAQRIKDLRRQVLSLYYQASALYYINSYDQAGRLLARAESIATFIPNDLPITVQILNLKASLAESIGNTVEAQTLYERSLSLAQESGQPRLIIMTLINKAELYLRLNLYELAEESVRKALTLAEANKEEEYQRNALKTLALVYLKQGKIPEALQTHRDIIAIAKRSGVLTWLKEAYGLAITQAIQSALPQVDTLLLQAEKDLEADSLLWAELLNWVASEGFLRVGSYAQAKDLYQNALTIAKAKNASTLAVQVLLNLANIYTLQALYPQAMEHLLEARRLCEMQNDSTMLPMVLNNLGEIYYNQEEWQKALEAFSLAADYANLAPDTRFPFQVAMNLAVVQIQVGNTEAGRNLLRESLILAEEAEDWISAAKACINLARLELDQGRVDTARRYLQTALRYAQKSRNPQALAYVYMTQGQFFLLRNQYREALQAYEAARLTLEPIEAYSELGEAYEKLIFLYGKLGAYEKGYRYIQPLLDAIRRLSNEENTRAMTRMELNYLYQKEREQQERRLEAEKLRAEKARQVTWVIIISATLLIGAAAAFLFVLYRANQREREINAQLAERNRLIEEQKALLEEQKAEIERAKAEIDESIQYARRIQMAILPDLTPFYERFPESFVLYLPRDVVSGDFYFYYSLSPTQSLLAVADCTGHGVPGAFMSMIGTTLLNRLAQEEGPKNPALLLQRLDEELRLTLHQTLHQEQIKDGMDIALCLIDTENQLLQFAGARRPLFVFTPEGELIELKGSRRSIGGDTLQAAIAFEGHTIPLRLNMSIYLFSDGIVDQFGWEYLLGQPPRRTKLLQKRLRDLLLQKLHLPAAKQKAEIEDFITHWRGDIPQLDDICLIGVRYTG